MRDQILQTDILFKGTIFNRQQADFTGVMGNKYHLLSPPQSHPQGHVRDKYNTR